MGFYLALGLPIAGKEAARCAVLYVGNEGVRGIKRRIVAARNKLGHVRRTGLAWLDKALGGYPRRGPKDGPFEGMKIQGWALREQGECKSLWFTEKGSGILLLANPIDASWTLLAKAESGPTCYCSAGESYDFRETSIRRNPMMNADV